jgi:mannose-6-phosphate isomerase-like protein (cupin superfamily)
VEETEPTERTLAVPPPPHGTKIRINEFLPGHLDERGLQPFVHRTASIDYGIVLEGEITLVLDDSEVTLRAGDIVVQRGTDHAWANRGSETARVVFVPVDGEFDPALEARLPDGLVGLMHGGPRD